MADLRLRQSERRFSKSIVPPERREAIRPVGPSRTRRRAPLIFFQDALCPNLGRETRRENESGWLENRRCDAGKQ